MEGNTLVLRQVEALLAEGRAVGDKELSEYLEVRGHANAARWVYGHALGSGPPIHRAPSPNWRPSTPNGVWPYDVTTLKGPARGILYELLVILDIFRRFCPGWMVDQQRPGGQSLAG